MCSKSNARRDRHPKPKVTRGPTRTTRKAPRPNSYWTPPAAKEARGRRRERRWAQAGGGHVCSSAKQEFTVGNNGKGWTLYTDCVQYHSESAAMTFI